jgi:hypothetical protein
MKNINWKKITKILLWIALGLFTGYAIYDVFPALYSDDGTISEITMEAAFQVVFLPYAWGVFTIHFYCPRKRKRIPFYIGIPIVTGIGLLLTLIVKLITPEILPIWYVFIGYPPAFFFWYLEHPKWKKENNQ